MDKDAAADRLSDARRLLMSRLCDLTADLDAHVAATAGSNADDEHDPEGATLAWDRQQLSAALTSAREQLVAVDAALHRLAKGRYGECQHCGRQISTARLDALPATAFCITCARR